MNCPLCTSVGRRFLQCKDARQYWDCDCCGLVWLDAAQRPSRVAEEARYRTHENDGAEYLSYLGKTALPIGELLPEGASGLDFGCGPTEGMKRVLSPLGFTVESYDPIFFPRADLLKNRYDFLLCSEAAEHFFEPMSEFERMNQLLKPGGLIGVSSRLSTADEKFEGWTYRRDPTHVVFYREKTVRWLADHFGWELLKLENPLWILRKTS